MTIESVDITVREALPLVTEYSTANLKVATYLVANGCELLRVDRSGRVRKLIFADPALCQRLEMTYPASEVCQLFGTYNSLLDLIK